MVNKKSVSAIIAGLTGLILLLTAGCASLVNSGSTTETQSATRGGGVNGSAKSANSPAMGMMDTTMGTYGEGREDRLILVTVENSTHLELLAGKPELAGMLDEKLLPVPYAEFLTSLKTQYGLTRVADWPLATIGIRCLVFESDGAAPLDQIVASLALESGVESAQGVQLFNARQEFYNDPFLHLQHGFRTIQAENSHQWATGDGVTVAVIDTGLDTGHPDLLQSLREIKNFVDKNEAQFHADVHGTAVAGIIAAAGNNETGMVGVAPEAKIIGLKACWTKSGATGATCNSYTLAKALNFAIANDVDVINLSLAGPRDVLLERLIQTAMDKNIVVVGAQDPDDKFLFPAAVTGTIAVGLPGDSANLTVWAPGNKVLSTAPDKEYEFYNGSSFSTAHISGLVALIKELQPQLSATAIGEILRNSVDADSGAVNACIALATLLNKNQADCVAAPET